VGKNGDWCVDFHQSSIFRKRFAVCDLIKDLAPYFVEDPVRAEAFQEDLPKLRSHTSVPIAAGEEWGTVGTSISWSRITTSITFAPRCPTSAVSPK